MQFNQQIPYTNKDTCTLLHSHTDTTTPHRNYEQVKTKTLLKVDYLVPIECPRKSTPQQILCSPINSVLRKNCTFLYVHTVSEIRK